MNQEPTEPHHVHRHRAASSFGPSLPAAAASKLAIEEAEPEPEESEEPEECAICLDDLPAAGGEGAVLLACSHSFHAGFLQRWKDKCLEKGLPYTRAMCRAAVVVAVTAEGEAKGKGT